MHTQASLSEGISPPCSFLASSIPISLEFDLLGGFRVKPRGLHRPTQARIRRAPLRPAGCDERQAKTNTRIVGRIVLQVANGQLEAVCFHPQRVVKCDRASA